MEFEARREATIGGKTRYLTPDGRMPLRCTECNEEITIEKDTEHGHYWHSCRCVQKPVPSLKEIISHVGWRQLQADYYRYAKVMAEGGLV